MGGIITLYNSTALTGSAQSNVANVLIPTDLNVVGVHVAVSADFKTDGAYLYWELSLSPGQSINQNGSYASLLRGNMTWGFVTSGLAQGGMNYFVAIPNFKCYQGEYLYLHQNGTNAVTPVMIFGIMVDIALRVPR